jgi:hypothetical protein
LSTDTWGVRAETASPSSGWWARNRLQVPVLSWHELTSAALELKSARLIYKP